MPREKPSTTPKLRASGAVRPKRLRPGTPPPRPDPVDDTAVAEIMRRFAAAMPDPRGELEHVDPYTLLVAVVLSAQATDKSVNIATAELFKVADNPAAMVALGEERLTGYIRTIGLFRTKAKNVIALSRRLLDEHGGIVPPARAVLESLPGVGRKTASVVLNVAFDEPTIAVDTHVFPDRRPQNPGRGAARARGSHPGGIPRARSPLADPARPLRVQGPHSRVPALPHRRFVPLSRQDEPCALPDSWLNSAGAHDYVPEGACFETRRCAAPLSMTAVAAGSSVLHASELVILRRRGTRRLEG